MQDYNELAQRHINNLKRASGIKNNGTGLRYDYIYTGNELLASWVKRQADLGYALRVEPKRDRYVMNSKAMQETLEECTSVALDSMQGEIVNFLQTDVRNEIINQTEEVLGMLNFTNTHTTSTTGIRTAKTLGTIFGKALAKNIIFLFNDAINGKKPKKKKRK